MRHLLKKLTALGLALALTAGQAALASEALGWDLHKGVTQLSRGTTVTRAWFWSDTYRDLRTERYLTYTPNPDVVPTVAYGSRLYEKKTLTNLARGLEEQGKRALGGTNGDFYVVSSGQPLGLVVTDGVLRSSASYHSAIGFRADGTAFIGKPELTITAWLNGSPAAVSGGVNKTRELTAKGGGLLLLTPDFGTSTGNYYAGVDVVLRPVPAAEAPATEEAPRLAESQPPEESEIPAESPTPAEGEQPQESDPPVENEAPEEAVSLPEESQGPEEGRPPEESQPPAEGETETPAEEPPAQEEYIPGAEGDETPFVPDLPAETDVPAEKEDLPFSDDLRIGSRVRCVVESVTETAGGAGPIPEGCFVLTMNISDDPAVLARLKDLWAGALVDIDVTAEDPAWSEAVTALGGMFQLLQGGEVAPVPAGNESLWKSRTARTAIGVKEDGTVLFYTIDGPISKNSVGATYTQVAKRLKELGCVDALGLDGGGSTTFGITAPDQESFGVTNTPRDGSPRAVTNAIFLTTTLPATGVPGSLQVEPGDAILLAGAQIDLAAWQVDTGWRRMDRADDVTYTVEGTGDAEGSLYTAGTEAGMTVLTAHQGELTGTALITTVVTPDKITVTKEATGETVTSLALTPGEQVSLTAGSVWRNLPLVSRDVCYTWTCDPWVGRVTADGTFTAGGDAAVGYLYVTAGEKKVSIPVSVSGRILLVDGMEGETTLFTSTDSVTASLTGDLLRVRSGRQSLRVDYAIGETGMAVLDVNMILRSDDRYLGLWVYGDGSGCELTALFAAADGTVTEAPFCTLDFTGWRHLLLAVPGGSALWTGLNFLPAVPEEEPEPPALEEEESAEPPELEGLPVTEEAPPQTGGGDTSEAGTQPPEDEASGEEVTTPEGEASAEGETAPEEAPPPPDEEETPPIETPEPEEPPFVPVTGTVWLDHLTRADKELEDFEAPAVTVKVEDAVLTAVVTDDLDFALPAGNILAKWDGQPLEGTWDPWTGTFTAALPEDAAGYPGRVTVTAWDQSGNPGRASVSVPGTVGSPFPDMEGHWAAAYADYLYGQGVTKGTPAGDGVIYEPGKKITRAEFATMVARWLGLDLSLYEEVEVPFADLDQVPDWALTAMKAVYAEGILTGSLEGGVLYGRPKDGVTRAQVMTILGRTQERGWKEVELDGFADGDDVPAWALNYVRSLVGQDVIHGYDDGTLRPNDYMTRAEAAVVLCTLR